MKLIERTTLYYLIYTLFIFAVGTLLFYFLIHNVVTDGIDEALHQEKEQMIENIRYETDFEDLHPTQNVILIKVDSNNVAGDKYSTISLVDSTGEKVNYRQLVGVYKHGDKYYKITIRQSLAEAESLIRSLVPVEIVLFLILLAGVLYLSNIISKAIWSPFYNLLDKVRNYNLSRSGIIAAVVSNVDEFDDLSISIERMTQKIHDDFVAQKEFHENSSHELQTPLAIIRSKLELLIQSRNMDENDLSHIQSIYDAVRRLSLLNKSLLLLSKIDNDQYQDKADVDLGILIKRIADNFKESVVQKKINLNINIKEEVIISANSVLMEVLMNNLFSNAVKHNIKGGFIDVSLDEKIFKISNSGNPLMVDSKLLFERFVKHSTSENSIGLGLSIVKKVCDISRFIINYSYNEGIHTVELNIQNK